MNEEPKKVVDVTDGNSHNKASDYMMPLIDNGKKPKIVKATGEFVDQMVNNMQRNEDEQVDTSENDH